MIPLVPIQPVRASTTWSSPTALFTDTVSPFSLDTLPSALQASNGQLWVAWSSNRFAPTLARYDLYYEVRTSGAWSAMVNLTSAYDNQSPSLLQLSNGTILLFFSSNPTSKYLIYYMSYNPGVWSGRIPATFLGNDSFPSAVVDGAGALWLFWTRTNFVSCGTFPCRQIYYKTLRNGVWSPETQLTTDPTYNIEHSAMVGKDGRLWTVYQKWQSSGQIYQLFYRTYNGAAWSSDIQLTFKGVWDERPSIMQDRNGTIWVFWDREIQITATTFETHIFSKYSYDNGVTWSADAQMTFDPAPGILIDDLDTTVVQGADKSIWLFFSSNLTGLGADFDIYYMSSSCICPVHDLKVASIQASPGMLYPGGLVFVPQSPIVKVAITVANLGDFPESITINVTAFNATTYNIGSGSIPSFLQLAPGSSLILTFYWNTTQSMLAGRYRVSALVSPPPGQTIGNRYDSLLIVNNLVWFLPLGDIDQDGNVNIVDFSVAAFGYQAAVGSPRYNPYADINGSGVIDIVDIAIVAKNYGIVT